ncbi:MAG: ATP-dependent Clp protease ATP-binding subunit [Candidatus Kuenenbacteria bacterium]
MSNQSSQPQIHTCSFCQGNGFVDSQKCKACTGYGVVLFLNNKMFFWGRKYSRLRISQQKQARKIRIIINLIFFIFGIVGFLSLAKAIYDLGGLTLEPRELLYVRNQYTLLFWISLIADTYLIYRINRESKIKNLIEKKPVLSAKAELAQEFDWANVKKYKKEDISKSFDQASHKIVEDGWLIANKLGHPMVFNIHLFATGLNNAQINLIFSRLGVNYKQMAEKIKRALYQITPTGRILISFEAKQALLNAYYRAYNHKKRKVRATDIISAIVSQDGIVKEILYDLSITQREIAHVAQWVDFQSKLIQKWQKLKYKASYKPKNAMNRAYTAVATPNLNQISEDMTLMARAGVYDLCVNRQNEIDQIFRVLKIDRTGAILVGPTGVGKRTIVEAIAELMVEEEVPKIMKDKRLVSLSVSGLIAGASKAGDLEARIITIMNEIRRAKNIILFIEDIHHLVGVSDESGKSMDMAEVLAEQMAASNFLVLASTTAEDYRQYIENSSLAKVLQKAAINEPSQDETIKILEAKTIYLEAAHKVYFSYQSIEQIAKLSARYLHDQFQPEKAIKILEETALNVKQLRGAKAIVSPDDVANIVADKTNIPSSKIGKNEKNTLLNLEQKMHQRVIGQESAINFVASALRRARTEIRSKNHPIASFLFLGPTGVGKTEVAKTLAESYFGSEKNMIRIDMSEYQANDAMAKLIGSAESGKAGLLTEAVRKNPFSLILLDEIEKANFDILNVFLQVLDDGRLTDAAGKTIDFTNVIIIATSNVCANYIQNEVKQGTDIEKIRQQLMDAYLTEKFRPEFLNRFDGIVVFHPLEMRHVIQIAKLFLNKLAERLEQKGIIFKVEEDAIAELARLGYEPSMGARPLRRVIQDRIEDQLAKLFLEDKIKRRDQVILGKELALKVNKAEEI